jgi:hypothetical protein
LWDLVSANVHAVLLHCGGAAAHSGAREPSARLLSASRLGRRSRHWRRTGDRTARAFLTWFPISPGSDRHRSAASRWRDAFEDPRGDGAGRAVVSTPVDVKAWPSSMAGSCRLRSADRRSSPRLFCACWPT